MRLRIDKHFNAIFAGESFSQTLLVIPHSLHQIRCYADIQRAVSSACHDVDKELFCHAGPPFLDSRPPTSHFEGMLRGNDALQSLSSPANCPGTRLPEDPKIVLGRFLFSTESSYVVTEDAPITG